MKHYFAPIAIPFLIELALFVVFLSSCSSTREGTTSPCYSHRHFVGYGPGGFGKHRMKN